MATDDEHKAFRAAVLKAATAIAEDVAKNPEEAARVAAAAAFFSAPIVASALGVGQSYFQPQAR